MIEVEGQVSKHSSFRQVRKTAAGTYLTSQQCSGGKAREYSVDRNKKLISTTGDAVKNRVSSLYVVTPR